MIPRAPYNFVPLPNIIVPTDGRTNSNDQYLEDYYSGYINITIKNKTPIFIGGKNSGTEDSRKIKFFKRGSELCIPGSSVRGLLRTMTEIFSFSNISFVDRSKILFHRNIGNSRYRNKVLTGSVPKCKPGYIVKTKGDNYGIFKAAEFNINGQLESIFRFNGQYQGRKFNVNGLNIDVKEHSSRQIWFEPTRSKDHPHRGRKLKYALISPNKLSITEKDTFERGTIIVTGKMHTRKHMNWIIGSKTDQWINVPAEVIHDYVNDSSRDGNINIIKACDKENEIVPCFYITNGHKDKDGSPEIISIGHTPIQRIAYKNNIGSFIKPDKNKLDIAQGMFGSTDASICGKLQFEDCLCKDEYKLENGVAKTLSSPKPTTYLHYLEQNKSGTKDWDSNDTKLRGNKLYWHSKHSWKSTKAPSKVNSILNVLEESKDFKGRINFNNLSKVELGCLITVLNLPENHCYKIGMGKSIGMGSIEITSDISLINRKSRYEKVFDVGEQEIKLNSASYELPDKDFKSYKIAFESYLEEHGVNTPLHIDSRIKNFLSLLKWDDEKLETTRWKTMTTYMDLKDFKRAKKDKMVLKSSIYYDSSQS